MQDSAEIVQVKVETFRSYGEASLSLAPLTLLIGPNASGKSNFIEGLRLLRWLGRGHQLRDFDQAAANGELAIRGRARDLPLDGHDTFRMTCRFDLDDEWISADTLSVAVQALESGLRVSNELLGYEIQGRPVYCVQRRQDEVSHDIVVAYDTLRDQGTVPCTDQQLVLTQLRTPAAFGAMGERAAFIPRVTRAYSEALSRIVFLDPEPRSMRGYVPHAGQPLMSDGSNLSGVLYALCQTEDKRREVWEFIRHLPEKDIRGIDFIKTDRGDVMLRLTEAFGPGEQVRDAPILSDGTLRVLAVAAAVLSTPPHSLLVIEEIDSGIHPSRAEALLEGIQRVAKERHLTVVLTSHNPALLDALPIEAIPHVACCFRDPQDGSSRIVHLGELDRYPELVAQGTVGRLMSEGVIERFLRDTRSPDERREDALKWVRDWMGRPG